MKAGVLTISSEAAQGVRETLDFRGFTYRLKMI
jgi:hypothetical protein